MICKALEVDCLESVENKPFNGDMSLDGTNDKNRYPALSFCQCLPQCESLTYEIELVKANLTDYMTIASLKVFFKDNEFVPLKRFQLYGTVDFLTNFGVIESLESLNKYWERYSLRRWFTRTVRWRVCLVDRRDFKYIISFWGKESLFVKRINNQLICCVGWLVSYGTRSRTMTSRERKQQHWQPSKQPQLNKLREIRTTSVIRK